MQNRRRVHHAEPGSAPETIIMLRFQIPKAREFGFKEQLDGAGRAMALLGDDQFRLVMRHFHILLPFIHGTLEFLGMVEGKLLGRALHQIIFVTIDEHHHLGVLFDGARLAQIRKLGALVFAAFHGTG